jgi:hypothetical protein
MVDKMSNVEKAKMKFKNCYVSIILISTIKKKHILRHGVILADGSKKIVPAMKIVYGPKDFIKRLFY